MCPGPGCVCTASTHVGSRLETATRHLCFPAKEVGLESRVELGFPGGRAAGRCQPLASAGGEAPFGCLHSALVSIVFLHVVVCV